jgi:hypothetical protein
MQAQCIHLHLRHILTTPISIHPYTHTPIHLQVPAAVDLVQVRYLWPGVQVAARVVLELAAGWSIGHASAVRSDRLRIHKYKEVYNKCYIYNIYICIYAQVKIRHMRICKGVYCCI